MHRLLLTSIFPLLLFVFCQVAHAQRNEKEYYNCFSDMIGRPTPSGTFAEAAANAAKCDTDTRANLRLIENRSDETRAPNAVQSPTVKGFLTRSEAATTPAGMLGQRCTYAVNGRSVQTLVQGLCPLSADFQ